MAAKAAAANPQVHTDSESENQTSPQRQPPCHVILWNDNDHTYEYVIMMLRRLFGHPIEKAFEMAEEVDAL